MKEMEELYGLLSEEKILKEKIINKKREIVEKYHPLQIGEIVEVNGYSHKGKKMSVTYRSLQKGFRDKYYFFAKGKIIKKDLTLGTQIGEWSDFK